MPISDLVVVSAVVIAFVVFAAVLAWGDYQTRNLDVRRQNERVDAQLASLKQRVEGSARETSKPEALTHV